MNLSSQRALGARGLTLAEEDGVRLLWSSLRLCSVVTLLSGLLLHFSVPAWHLRRLSHVSHVSCSCCPTCDMMAEPEAARHAASGTN